jgi:hypothetical protein
VESFQVLPTARPGLRGPGRPPPAQYVSSDPAWQCSSRRRAATGTVTRDPGRLSDSEELPHWRHAYDQFKLVFVTSIYSLIRRNRDMPVPGRCSSGSERLDAAAVSSAAAALSRPRFLGSTGVTAEARAETSSNGPVPGNSPEHIGPVPQAEWHGGPVPGSEPSTCQSRNPSRWLPHAYGASPSRTGCSLSLCLSLESRSRPPLHHRDARTSMSESSGSCGESGGRLGGPHPSLALRVSLSPR